RRVRKGFSGVETPLFESMLVVKDVTEEAEAQVPAQGDNVQEPATEEVVPPTSKSSSPSSPPHQPPCPPQPQDAEEVQEVVKIVTTAKLMTEVVTVVTTQVAAASTPIPDVKPKILTIVAAPAEMEAEDEEIIKSINETPAQKAAKRRKPSEEAQEAKDLRKRLEIVHDKDDDVFVEATPLAQKTIFEEPDGQDAIWRNQKSVHGLALVKRWKLLTLCGVHVITLSTVQLFLLVEKRYPLSRFTLEQLVNVARLQVEEESEMSLELLRRSKKNTKCVNAVNEELTADCQSNIDAARLKLKLFKNITAAEEMSK
nr:hypothetical protein [Tanacetum cinerariifolium]